MTTNSKNVGTLQSADMTLKYQSIIRDDSLYNYNDSRVVNLLQAYLGKLNSNCLSLKSTNNQLEKKLNSLKNAVTRKELEIHILKEKLGFAGKAKISELYRLLRLHDETQDLKIIDGSDTEEDDNGKNIELPVWLNTEIDYRSMCETVEEEIEDAWLDLDQKDCKVELLKSKLNAIELLKRVETFSDDFKTRKPIDDEFSQEELIAWALSCYETQLNSRDFPLLYRDDPILRILFMNNKHGVFFIGRLLTVQKVYAATVRNFGIQVKEKSFLELEASQTSSGIYKFLENAYLQWLDYFEEPMARTLLLKLCVMLVLSVGRILYQKVQSLKESDSAKNWKYVRNRARQSVKRVFENVTPLQSIECKPIEEIEID